MAEASFCTPPFQRLLGSFNTVAYPGKAAPYRAKASVLARMPYSYLSNTWI